MPSTRTWATVGIIGVPLGAHTDWLSINTSGWPLEKTRVAATVHCPVTQGIGFVPVVNGQADITYGALINTVGWPLTVTRGFGAVGCACPPCAHMTVAPTCNSGPGI